MAIPDPKPAAGRDDYVQMTADGPVPLGSRLVGLAASGIVALLPPAASLPGTVLTFVSEAGLPATFTLRAQDGETVGGAASVDVAAGVARVYSNGSAWIVA